MNRRPKMEKLSAELFTPLAQNEGRMVVGGTTILMTVTQSHLPNGLADQDGFDNKRVD